MDQDKLNDRDLVHLAVAGDRQAFGQLIERYQLVAKSIAIRMVANEDIALDLVQESVVQAMLSLGNLRDPAAFRSWFSGIVINLCRGYLRDRESGFLYLENLPDGSGTDAFGSRSSFADPEGQAEKRDLQNLVLSAMEGLSPNQRQAVLLHYFRRLNIQEIAVIEDVSVGAGRSQGGSAQRRDILWCGEAAPG